MTTDSGCRKLNQDCSSLQTECSKRLSIAIGNSKNAKKCKKALKTDGQTLVESFCADTCNKCGKFNLWFSCNVRDNFTNIQSST